MADLEKIFQELDAEQLSELLENIDEEQDMLLSQRIKQKALPELTKEEKAPEIKIEKKTSGKSAVRQGESESDNMLELLSLLKEGALTPSELSEKSGKPFKWVASTLIILEVSGKVKMLSDGKYAVN